MLWIVRDDDTVYLFKGKVVVAYDDEGDFLTFVDTDGRDAYVEFDFCSATFTNVTGLTLPNLKPKKLLLMVK